MKMRHVMQIVNESSSISPFMLDQMREELSAVLPDKANLSQEVLARMPLELFGRRWNGVYEKRLAFQDAVDKAAGTPLILYHITNNPRFKLNPNYAPEDNSFAMTDRSGHKGIYLGRDVETWMNGHGYVRPFVAEIEVQRSALEHDNLGRWGGEVFIPAEHFDKLKVLRVVPLDVICREKFGRHGWIEGSLGREFDTGNEIGQIDGWKTPFDGWRYEKDVRTLPADEVKRLKQHFRAGHKACKAEGY